MWKNYAALPFALAHLSNMNILVWRVFASHRSVFLQRPLYISFLLCSRHQDQLQPCHDNFLTSCASLLEFFMMTKFPFQNYSLPWDLFILALLVKTKLIWFSLFAEEWTNWLIILTLEISCVCCYNQLHHSYDTIVHHKNPCRKHTEAGKMRFCFQKHQTRSDFKAHH